MQEFFGQEIQPAETLFDGRGLRPQEPKEPGKGLLTVRENGATKGYVVPQDVAQMFDRLTPESKMATIQMLSRAFRGIVYPLIIRYNPVFQLAMSPMRDFQRLMVNAPDGSHWRIAKAYMRELWKALADPSRLRIVAALQGRELCLCQLVELVGLATSTVSRHMSILERARLVDARRRSGGPRRTGRSTANRTRWTCPWTCSRKARASPWKAC
jgi:DNA-binding transcriptional ArsR family regulator